MIRVWLNYTSDLGRAYPMYALRFSQVNDVDSSINPVDLLSVGIKSQIRTVKNGCGVPGLTARQLSLWTSDGAQFLINYPDPFSESLAQYLTANTSIAAWEFIGEKIKYGRLRRMLENV